MRKIYFTLTILITFNLYPQILDITRFPYQSREKKYFESTPAVISQNEILFFYCSGNSKSLDYWSIEDDTLYFSKSNNGGHNWSSPATITILGQTIYNRNWFLTSLRTSSGRILLAWADWREGKIVVVHSDDNALTWSEKTYLSSTEKSNLVLSEIEDGRIILSYALTEGFDKRVLYRESTDNGQTWSQNPVFFYSGSNKMSSVSFINLQNKMLAFFDYDDSGIYQNAGIYFRESTDNGISWSAIEPVIDLDVKEHNPRIIKYSEDELSIIYQVDTLPMNSNNPNDIYSIRSSDGGETWLTSERFTSYAGDDNYIQAAKVSDKAFITFSTTRFTNKPQISYAIIGETVEQFRPPYITSVFANADSLSRKHWLISANVIDDEEVVKVTVTFNDGSDGELFDDGLHNDGEANDDLYANVVLLNTLEPSTASKIDVNKLTLPFNNKGIIADTWTSFSQKGVIEANDNRGYLCQFLTDVEEGRGAGAIGRYEEGGFLFSSGFILSGYSNGNLWSNAVASASLVEDYLPGMVGSNQNDPLNKIYTIYKDDPPFGSSWQYWIDAVSLGAKFYDGDGDGIYNPVDKNFNGIWERNEDMPLLLGDVTAWCVFNDALPKNMRRWNTADPLGIEVRQTMFATNNSELENVIFIKYSILNTGSVVAVMDSVYFGVWEDADVGDATDDVVGCDTLLQSGFYYGNSPDAQYGENPPSFFSSLLQGPIVESNNPSDTAYNFMGELIGTSQFPSAKNLKITSHIFNIGGDPELSDPNSAVEARCYLKGKTRICTVLNPCSFPFCEVRGGIDCHNVDPLFWASGDPITNIGWISTQNRDMRNLISTGPFHLEKDKPQEIIIAYVIGRGTDPLNSITVARENVQRAIQEYQSNFASMTYTPPAPTNPVTSYFLYQNYPNPFNPTTTIRYELPQDGVVTIELFDILGQKVKTILNELKRADRYEITFNSSGLASGVYIYQLRVNDFITSKKMVILK